MNSATPFPLFPDQADTPVLKSDACAALLDRAAPEERGEKPICGSIDILRAEGLMLQDSVDNPQRTTLALMQIGAANLSVGRLWEGHVNALQLIRLYGTAAQVALVEGQIDKGALLGVWGADGPLPLTAGRNTLQGAKHCASGLGTVTHALVTVNSGPEVQLALIEVTDTQRADDSHWDMQGMRATASGRYNFAGLALPEKARIGAPGDYLIEPHFVGGVWRIAALQAGASMGLLNAAAGQLRKMERLEAEAQKARLMEVLMRVWAGTALVERAAQAAADDQAPDTIVATAIAARLYTEGAALAAIQAVEQSLGLGHFAQGAETGRMARDLSVYLRQAARDVFLQRAAGHALSSEKNIWGVFK